MTKVIGYYITEKKCKALEWHEKFVPLARENGFEVVRFDPGSTEKIDVLISKLNEEYAKYDTDKKSKETIDWFKAIEDQKLFPIIDPQHAQLSVSDRFKLSEKLEELDHGDLGVENPKFCVIEHLDQLEETLQKHHIRFPVMSKTIKAIGSVQSHMMEINFNVAHLKENLVCPAFIQEYFDHDGTIYKAFTIGDYTKADIRSSTLNFGTDDRERIVFNSQEMQSVTDQETYKSAQPLDNAALSALSAGISKATGLTLFGFDVIRNKSTQKLAIIDINYFPGFVGVPDFAVHLLNLVKSVLAQ